MKTELKSLKADDTTHQEIKVMAAQAGCTTTTLIRGMVRHCRKLVDSGKIKLATLIKEEVGK